MNRFSYKQVFIVILLSIVFSGSFMNSVIIIPQALQIRYAMIYSGLFLLIIMFLIDQFHFLLIFRKRRLTKEKKKNIYPVSWETKSSSYRKNQYYHFRRGLDHKISYFHSVLYKDILIFLWFSFSFMVIISGLVNEDLFSIKDGLTFLVIWPIVFFYLLPKLMKQYSNLIITLAMILGLTPFIIVSLFLKPPRQLALYSGIFLNPNTLGMIAALTSGACLVLLIGTLAAKKSQFYILLITLLGLGCLTVNILSTSRTPLISLFLTCLLVMFNLFFISPKMCLKITFISIGFLSLIYLLIQLFFGSLTNKLLLGIIDQGFRSKLEAGSLLSDRETIWINTLKNTNLLGYGFEKHPYFTFELGGHNTLIHSLGLYGVIAAFILLIFMGFSCWYSYWYWKNYSNNDYFAVAPFVFTMMFCFISMGESMLSAMPNSSTCAYFISIGVIMNKSLSRPKSFR